MSDIKQQFVAFHEANPTVLDELVDLADQLVLHGQRKGSIKQLFEVLRWERMFTTTDPSGFKLNNNYTSHYARLIMDTYPRYEGFFELRSMK